MQKTIQIFLGLLAIGMVNLFYFQYMTNNNVKNNNKIDNYNNKNNNNSLKVCTPEIYMQALKLFVDNDGRTKFFETVSIECSGQFNENIDELMKNLLSKAIRHCHTENMARQSSFQEHVTLTLFTSWSSTPSKFHVHNNTVINWGTFMPRVNLVLFTYESFLANFVEERGWSTYPIIHHVPEVAPILKYMFLTVKNDFNTTFYGYANSDILFDSSLLDTLTAIYDTLKDPLEQNGVFISGRRTNIDFVSMKEAASYGNIKHAAERRGVLYDADAEDYFITDESFNWSEIPDLVIGRRAYDNWLVLHACTLNATTIDATRTVLAVHQTTKEGNLEGHNRSNPHFNDDLLIELGLNRYYNGGATTCMGYETFQSLCDETIVSKRQDIPNFCLPP